MIFSRAFNLGHGSTWPGHIALIFNKHFIQEILRKNKHLKAILIAGTNGKTTTGKMIQTILEKDGKKVFQNESGANLLNGIASTLIQRSNKAGKIADDYAIFEVDENILHLALEQFTPNFIVLLNLFRDQLDRYGEVDSVAKKWHTALQKLPSSTTIILNADDPQIAYLGTMNKNVLFFGLNDPKIAKEKMQHAVDSVHCPDCHSKLVFKEIYFSHLGNWHCPSCKLKRPELDISRSSYYPLSGLYNKYNTLATILVAKANDSNNETIEQSLKQFKPAFGRQETIDYQNKKIRLFLSKNPTSMNESLKTITELNAQHVLLVLNDRIPDGRDVSWIWDVDFEEFLTSSMNIIISGDRAYDMGLRIKYTTATQNSKIKAQNHSLKFKIFENLSQALTESINNIPSDETLYILPTYSAMLEVRKILTGKKIL